MSSWIRIVVATLYVIPTAFALILTPNNNANTDIDTDSPTTSSLNQKRHAESLIQWLTSTPGGFFHPHIELRPTDHLDPSSPLGIFALRDIPAKTVLMTIPESIILDSTEDDPRLTPLVCGTVRNLAHHLNLGDASPYAPYISYLLATQSHDLLPSAWSTPGQRLLLTFLGDTGPFLPPDYATDWITDDWLTSCSGSTDPISLRAALLVVSRASDDLLIPIYDAMRHRNGKWFNTASTPVHEGDNVEVSANRRIREGEELYTSQNLCDDCGGRFTTYGTAEILRDYGVVEEMPQSWIFPDINVAFRIDFEDGGTKGKVVLTEWIKGRRVDDEETVKALKELLENTEKRRETLLSTHDKNLPLHEYNTILSYADALIVAMSTALSIADVQDLSCIENGTCTIPTLQRYHDLDDRELSVNTDDVESDAWPTCNDVAEMGKFDDGTYDLVQSIKSPYQTLNFLVRPVDNETCFDLDDKIQICDSYRPHYHELQVHQVARYLEEMKRVLFVGGGDSMFLHEFLKYPSIELVVGLELDQRVVRGSFRHFGVSPHFDDPRVEWWFGDATKSLVMLPKEYFGSFDMVVVDLSETVMSFTVTKKLDVIEALTLLLKPEGVFIKNEFYYGQFRGTFPYSVQMHWYDNPVICSQGISIGSYLVDFMKTPQTDFGVDGLLIQPVKELEDPYEHYHDYTRNHTSRQLCDDLLDENDESSSATDKKVQTDSPGILFVVEAEDVSVDLWDVDRLTQSLAAALEKVGLTDLSTTTTTTNGGSIVTLMMKEGYVLARTIPERSYIGFDLHFWATLDKHPSAIKSLLRAVGGKPSSSSTYRIIAGGIFGVESWEQDEKERGPRYDEICEQRERAFGEKGKPPFGEEGMGRVEERTVDRMWMESVRLAPGGGDGSGKRIMVLVGSDGKIGSSGVVRDMEEVKAFETLHCPSMSGFNRFDSTALEKAMDCEGLLTYRLMDLTAQDQMFNVLVIDSTADKITASILLKIFSTRRNKFVSQVLKENMTVVSVLSSDDDGEKWRQNLVQLFKVDVFKFDPAWYVELGVSDGAGAMKVLIAKSGEHFIQRLNKAVMALEEKSELSVDVQFVDGGEYVFQEDPFEPTRSFLPSNYDKTLPLEQWNSQVPLGHQIIFQMENTVSISQNSYQITADSVKSNLETAIVKTAIPGLELSKDTIKEYTDVGEGCVLMSTWSGGSIVVLWDGRKHIDVNFFTYKENIDIADAFESFFRTSEHLTTKLRDEQPRGIGRVVSYFSDLEDNFDPHWAY